LFKIKAEPSFNPQAYFKYVEDLKQGSNAEIGPKEYFEIAYSKLSPKSVVKPMFRKFASWMQTWQISSDLNKRSDGII